MNVEKKGFNSEKEKTSEALQNAGLERYEQLRNMHERTGEKSHEELSDIRKEALEVAKNAEQRNETHEQQDSKLDRHKGPIGKREREKSFDTTMHEVQSEMSTPSRLFSQVIHNATVERVSDVAANTIARPNALLSGAVVAFALTLAVYLVAKNLGYPLSGFETIGAFVVGWIIGIAYDFLKVMVTGKK